MFAEKVFIDLAAIGVNQWDIDIFKFINMARTNPKSFKPYVQAKFDKSKSKLS